MIIRLSDNEFETVRMLAIGRHLEKDIVIPNRNIERWNNSQHEADLLGVMGEYAVSKYLRIPFDCSINLNGDGGRYDMFLGDWSIQVKATKYPNGRLAFNGLDELKALINILTICDEVDKSVIIRGFISKADFLKKTYVRNLGHGDRYCVDQSDLEDIDQLAFYYGKFHPSN